MVYVNNVILGQQLSFTFRISDDGYFKVKIPHTNPQTVYIRQQFFNESVYIEPGKTVFQYIDKSNSSHPVMYMGEGARINNDLYRLKDIYSFNGFEMRDKILEFTPEQYELYCENSLIRDLNRLKEYCSDHRICARAQKLWEMVLNYRNANQLLSYQMNFTSAYRLKNKIPNTQRR